MVHKCEIQDQNLIAFFLLVMDYVKEVKAIKILGGVGDKKLQLAFIVSELHWSNFRATAGFNAIKQEVSRPQIPEDRIRAMVAVLEDADGVMEIFPQLKEGCGYDVVDVFLFPEDWESRIPEISSALGFPTTKYLEGARNSAIPITEDLLDGED